MYLVSMSPGRNISFERKSGDSTHTVAIEEKCLQMIGLVSGIVIAKVRAHKKEKKQRGKESSLQFEETYIEPVDERIDRGFVAGQIDGRGGSRHGGGL